MTPATQPFEGIRVIDATHVLAGPFAAYQLGVLGADVIKIEDPNDPDQSRSSGTDKALNDAQMGTSFLTQASNKRSVALDLKQERDRDILKALVKTADVFVENYRPGAFEALGLGYDALSAINPRLIYASFSAFGQNGPRGGYVWEYLSSRFHFGFSEAELGFLVAAPIGFDVRTYIWLLFRDIDWIAMGEGLVFVALVLWLASEYRRRRIV
jgi:hypothetical protein